MTGAHDHPRASSASGPRSAFGTAVVAVVAYEVTAGLVNDWLEFDVMPLAIPRIQAATPRTIVRAATPGWTRVAGWIAVGAAYTVAAKAARSALPARLRR